MNVRMQALAALGFSVLSCAALAQPVQQYDFPSTPGSASPPSTLRITETPGAMAVPPANPPVVVRDTPESLDEYQRCRTVSDRAAVDSQQMRIGVATCLKELEARRQPR
ncbi:Uncharacterised protein [Bordetella ansorpii]|uniref:Lipoprotein n=2 Tax=Bordetella ansorpii TaxID=288768 RepID=A0A157RIL4_9BORD|nr:Uncharacterised protein [Bordetella ansorpii]